MQLVPNKVRCIMKNSIKNAFEPPARFQIVPKRFISLHYDKNVIPLRHFATLQKCPRNALATPLTSGLARPSRVKQGQARPSDVSKRFIMFQNVSTCAPHSHTVKLALHHLATYLSASNHATQDSYVSKALYNKRSI